MIDNEKQKQNKNRIRYKITGKTSIKILKCIVPILILYNVINKTKGEKNKCK